MKKIQLFKGLFAIITLMILNVQAFAQDKKIDLSITTDKTTTSNWYTQPWVWIVGGAVFVLLLVALLRSNKDKA